MSPELEWLLNALYQTREGDAKHRARWQATAERLIDDALAKLPIGYTREHFMDGIEMRYRQFRRAKRTPPPTLPPQA